MTMFWVIVTGLTAGVFALLVLALRASGRDVSDDSDIQVYRDQLAEVERDLARGTLDPTEGERARAEVSRRVIEADRAARQRAGSGRAPKAATLTVAGLAALVLGGSIWLYATIGAPGYPDLPLKTRIAMADAARKARPDQAAAEAEAARLFPSAPPSADPEYTALMERLRTALKARPDDLQGHRLLARNEAGLENFRAAAAAQARVLEILGSDATSTEMTDLAEYLIRAAGGYVSPEAEAALTRALQADTSNGRARYFSGLLYAQTGRPDLAFRLWRGLLETGADSAPWIPAIRAQIDEIAALAGVRYDPPAPRGPSADDIANAQTMEPDERDGMVRGMVSGLAERLATEGGPPEDWARLIVAYGVLGETDRARAILTEARQVFAEAPGADSVLDAAAARAGLDE